MVRSVAKGDWICMPCFQKKVIDNGLVQRVEKGERPNNE